MKDIKIYLAIMGLLAFPIASAYSASHKAVPSKHKPAHPPATQKSPDSATADSWKPDPTLVNSLGQQIQVSEYAMRLPEGYSEVAPPPNMIAPRQNGFNSHLYSSSRRTDGTAPGFGFTIATPPPGMIGTLSLDDALEGTLEQKKHQWQNFIESPIQDGQISGLAFERVYFKGLLSGAAGTRMAHGFAYVAIDGKNILSFQVEDAEPYNDQSIPIAQAAVLTFHRMSAAVSAQMPIAPTFTAKSQPAGIGSLTAYGRHFPNGKAAVEYVMGPDGLWKHMTNLEYVWNYYGNLPYSNFPVPARHPGNVQALIDAADGTRNFTCLAVNSNLMCDSKHRGEIDGTEDYNHDGYPDIPDAGWGFCEHNGKGVGGVTRQKPFTVFWYDDNWVAKLFTQAYGKPSPDGVYEYANNHNHWQPLCRVIQGNYNPYQMDFPNTVELDALYYLWTGDKAKSLSLWDHLRDQCHPVWDTSLQRYQYSVASDGTYIFGVFKILTDSLLEHGLLTAPKREELLQHSMSLRSFLISLQEKDSQGNLLGWNGAVGHAEGLINTEGTFMSILGLSPLPGSEVYEAGRSPLSFESKNYTLRPSNVYSSVSSLSQPGYMTSGPNYIYPEGDYQVDYFLRCPAPPANAKIATLSVAPSQGGATSLCSEDIDSSVFRSNNWIKRTINFTLAQPTPLSFQTYWWGKADMDIACIQVRRIK